MKKKNAIGACVLAAAIVLAVPLGVHTSLTKLREDAENTYYYDNAGYAIYEGVEERQATANNDNLTFTHSFITSLTFITHLKSALFFAL